MLVMNEMCQLFIYPKAQLITVIKQMLNCLLQSEFELELTLWRSPNAGTCVCSGKKTGEESQGRSRYAGSHAADKVLSGRGADCRLGSNGKEGRKISLTEAGPGGVEIRPTLLSPPPQRCILHPFFTRTLLGTGLIMEFSWSQMAQMARTAPTLAHRAKSEGPL